MLTWQFVDSIASSPTVRLDLNTLTAGIHVTDQPELSPPQLRRVISSSMMADGEKIPAAAFANRVLRIPLYVRQTTTDLQATLLQSLARELSRQPGNILRLTIATNPMFFRTFPAPDAAYQAAMRLPAEGKVILEIPCEPFGYGLEEVLSPITVANNPASANGLFFDITPNPKGDVETPLYLTVANGVVGTGRRKSGFAVRRRGTVASTPLFLQAESMTMGTNTATVANSALMSGTSNNYTKTTPGTTSMVTRLSTTTRFPSSASVDARGTYRAYARVRQATTTDVWDVRLRWGGIDVQVTNETVRCPPDVGPSTPTIKMVNLGLVQIPVGFDPMERGINGVEVATEGVYLDFQVQRVSGSGTFDVDYLLFMPADDRAELILWPESASVTDFFMSGGPSPSVYARNASAQIVSTQSVEIAGTGLMITPGRTNRVFFHRDVGTTTSATGGGDVVTATTSVTPSYYPRYLFPLKPATT